MNKSNVKNSLLDLINNANNSDEKAKLSAMSPKTDKKLGYASVGVTEVDKQLINAKTSLQSLLLQSADMKSQERL